MREISALDKAMQTTRGNLNLNKDKLSEIDKEIKDIEELCKSARDRGDEDLQEVEKLRKQLQEKQDERSVRLDAASINERTLRSQMNRIKETIIKMAGKNIDLRETFLILFREQGVTIVNILAAISLAISTLRKTNSNTTNASATNAARIKSIGRAT